MPKDSSKPSASTTCPYCGKVVEEGWLRTHDSPFAFTWYSGKPSFIKSVFPLGEGVGETSPEYGSFMVGYRCKPCGVLILAY